MGRVGALVLCAGFVVAGCSDDSADLTAERCVDDMVELIQGTSIEEIRSGTMQATERWLELDANCAFIDNLSERDQTALYTRLVEQLDPETWQAVIQAGDE